MTFVTSESAHGAEILELVDKRWIAERDPA
jgi:hypothetical protein